MHVAASGSSPLSAIAAGVRHQLNTRVVAQTLDSAGVLDEPLRAAFTAVEEQARGLTEAGIAAHRLDLVGSLVDVLG